MQFSTDKLDVTTKPFQFFTAKGVNAFRLKLNWESEKGGSYKTITRFFNSTIDWGAINWLFIQTHLTKMKGSVYLLGGNEVVVSKSGKHSYGLDRFYSSLQNQVIKSLAFLNLSLAQIWNWSMTR